ncbi:hypothetical protein BGX30_004988 [Mortierella sp. GBA39]|nr:hypothetical protein BGX30_004988 [Mortierella sp. GBA39]
MALVDPESRFDDFAVDLLIKEAVLNGLLNKDNPRSLVELDLDLMPFLAGSWYLEETGAHISGQSNPDPWKLESLRTPRQHLRILRMCDYLRRLELTHNQHSVELTSLSPLLSCPGLRELIFTRGGFNVLDFGWILPHLNALTLLKIVMSRQE